jgi:hypothetical protein
MKKCISKQIAVTFQRVGFHRYPDAPSAVEYLQHTHRHIFKFKVTIDVMHLNREIEFHMFLNWLESQYQEKLSLDFKSCEMISDDLADIIAEEYPGRNFSIEVWEDGECGSISTYQS